MTKRSHPPASRQKEAGNFNRHYAVPLLFVISVLGTWLLIVILGSLGD